MNGHTNGKMTQLPQFGFWRKTVRQLYAKVGQGLG